MALQDFIQKLQEEDENIKWSTPPEDNSTHIITPVSSIDNSKQELPPKVIKFTLKKKEEVPEVIFPTESEEPEVVIPKESVYSKPKEEKPVEEPIIEHPKEELKSKKSEGELLFERSETSLGKKEIWFEYYEKALKSKKDNYITQKCKAGRFTIDSDNKFIILPDYDTYEKTTQDILNDKWF